MLEVIINGCNGAMGQVLSRIIKDIEDIQLVAGIDKNPKKYKNNYPVFNNIFDFKQKADVIIDFSNPQTVQNLLKYGVETNTPLVIATTGLSNEDMKKLEEAAKSIPIFQTGNTSLGINVLIDFVKKAAVILNEGYDIEIIEKHHNKKIDSPSGTAFMIAKAMNEELDNSKEFVYGREGNMGKRTKNEIGIHAVRGGTIPGEHTVIFAGQDEVIEVKHTAFSKDIFAIGAINAARFIVSESAGLYNMDDLIDVYY